MPRYLIEDGKLRHLIQDWQLSDTEAADLFMSDEDLAAQDYIERYAINDHIRETNENAHLALALKLLTGELAERYVANLRKIFLYFRSQGMPLPIEGLHEKKIKPSFSLYDHKHAALALNSHANAYQNGKPIFYETAIAPHNILMVFNPPAGLSEPWGEDYITFYLQLMDIFWESMRELCEQYGVSVRRLNRKRTHVQDEIYYALEFSFSPLADFEP